MAKDNHFKTVALQDAQTKRVVHTPAYGTEKVADVWLVMDDESEVKCEIIPSKTNWCMVPLNGRKISSVVGTFVNRNSRFLISENCMQLVYFL